MWPDCVSVLCIGADDAHGSMHVWRSATPPTPRGGSNVGGSSNETVPGEAKRQGDGELLGRVLEGRFRLDRRIGSGGMGEVYLARQLNIERNVAIKVLRRERLGDADAVARFLREARTISRLTSPHTVTLHDVGELSEGDYFIAMEYLEGRTLQDLLDLGSVPQEEAVRILDSIALSLAEAHAQGIVHRDLKPVNVLLGRAAEHAEIVKVVDFGLASIGRSEDDPRRRGTPRYMAPEAIRGRVVGPRADVYALGLIAFEMFAGQHPFGELSGPKLLEAHLRRDAPPLDAIASSTSIPRAARTFVARCLAKPPKLRPKDASAFRRQLREAFGLSTDTSTVSLLPSRERSAGELATLETKATLPSTMSLTEFERRFSKPQPRWRWLVGGLLGSALAVGLFSWQGPAESPPAAAPPAPRPVMVLIHSVPEGADVTLDGDRLGVTPTNVALSQGVATTISLQLDGFEDGHLTVTPREGAKVRHIFRPVGFPMVSASDTTTTAEVSAPPPPAPPPPAPPPPAPPPAMRRAIPASPSGPPATDKTSAPVADPRDKVHHYLD
jgi:eukaryotic-like serine/threonine-protein kinase